jgi:hypothetical protein
MASLSSGVRGFADAQPMLEKKVCVCVCVCVCVEERERASERVRDQGLRARRMFVCVSE